MNQLKRFIPDLAMVVLFLGISLVYFFTPVSQGLVLDGHDNTGGVGAGREIKEMMEKTGEMTRWTDAVFGGMPTYQLAPTYDSTSVMQFLRTAYGLGTSGVLSYLFLYLLGFYILLRAFNFRPYLAALGAVLWAFSSYFLIIIAAGHIWKVMALAYLPPLIGGIILCYRGRLLLGATVVGIFSAFEMLANHVQMTYYYAFIMGFIVLAYGIAALWPKTKETDSFGVKLSLGSWAKATGAIVFAGILGVLVSASNLYHTYEYTAQSMRGGSELKAQDGSTGQSGKGLSTDYMTNWSYGIGETMTLLIPDFKGGGSGSVLEREDALELPGYETFYQQAGQVQQALGNQQVQLPGLNQYWGDQPFTVGPVYVGAFVCFLFVLGAFFVRGPLKWALLAATLLSFFFAWGRNAQSLTDFFVSVLPMYNKFRTVSSALVMAEFTIPLLAILGLHEVIRRPERLNFATASKYDKVGLGVSLALTAGVCLALWLVPSLCGDLLSVGEMKTFQALQQGGVPDTTLGLYRGAIGEMRGAILSADALRSLLIILLGLAALYAYVKGWLKAWVLCLFLAILCGVDMWQIDKRYLNDSKFVDPVFQQESLQKRTAADDHVLQDKSHYRVLDLTKDPFNSNETALFHNSIGGYHPAKMSRYQDLIDRCLQKEIPALGNAVSAVGGDLTKVNVDSLAPALNMLNTKYLIFGDQAEQVVVNTKAAGNAWFVRSLNFVEGANAEMDALGKLNPKTDAVADAQFKAQLDGSALDSGKVVLTSYTPNELHYTVESTRGGVVVFSEVYYPHWSATIDGQSVEIGRANYLLRALKVPAGKHEVVMTFRPQTVTITETTAYVASALILLLLVGVILKESGVLSRKK